MNADEDAVASVLMRYGDALNRSDADAVTGLYAPDGVFMPQNSPSSIGRDAIHAAYRGIFDAITLAVTFSIAEVRQLAPDWVMARTNSVGTVRINATGGTSAEANQELFLFQKLGEAWTIARYCFSTTNPPPTLPEAARAQG